MSSPSKKHQKFLTRPMGEKPVTDLPGIGDALEARLQEKGFFKAYNVMGKFLVLSKDEKKFKKWLHYVCDANTTQQGNCYCCLQDWCLQNL